MNPIMIALLLAAGGLGFVLFRISRGSQWHWALGLALATVPVVLTFFLGAIGILASALFVGSMYKIFGW